MIRFLFAGALLLLGGCASLPERPPVSDRAATFDARSRELAPLNRWRLTGRIALQTADEGWQATLVWVREQDEHKIDLMGPLGRGHMRLTQNATGAVLRDAEQRAYYAANGEALLLRITGWQVPLTGLNHWMLGLPVPEVDADSELDDWGRLKQLRQLGWDIEFLEYTAHGAHELPSKLFMKRREVPRLAARAGAAPVENGALEVRLVVERWTTL